ncbi:MAG: PTS sugar transporter subunit IIC [Coriobacteriaceae bacterium]|nr:MAG: PTS sugar transporter subunit IIC [Coriobacteriaceae bacterium]
MHITLFQAFLVGVVYYLSINGTPWTTLLGSTILRTPLVGGLLTGLILGNPMQGALIGAAIQLPYIAYISAGGSVPTDPGLAGTLGTALALAANVDPNTAIAIATPIGLLGTIVWVVHMTVDVPFVHMCDRAADRGDMKALTFWHLVPPQIVAFLIGTIPVMLGVYYGSGVVTNIINTLQGRPLETLQVIGGILPAIGIGMNLRSLDRSYVIPLFIFGFVISAYSGLSTLPLAILAGIAASLITGVMDNISTQQKQRIQAASVAANVSDDVASDDSDADFE